jgi:radical SAM protein with 4Fe4S-binding SPASM domain
LGKDKSVLDLDRFTKILNQFPNLRSIKLQGLGEPLLNKNLGALIEECKKRDIYIEFFSNGSIYNHEIWEIVNETEKINVKFSIDAASKIIFEKIRKGSNFEKVVTNIKKIVKNNEKKYSFWTVVNKQNLAELPKIILLANEIGINKVTFQTFLSNWKSKRVEMFTEKIKIDNYLDDFFEYKNKAKDLAEKFKIALDIYEGNFLSKKNKCSWPFTSAFIASNGDIVPCCVISDSHIINMGNLFETDFSEIWNSNKYKDFRRSIKKHQLKDFCKNCYGEE